MTNMRAALLMVAAMAFFAAEDTGVKLLSGHIPVGEILIFLGGLGGLAFWGLLLRRGGRLFTKDLLSAPMIYRNVGEVIAAFGYVLAVALTPLSSASAIIQAIPLVVTMGAALILGETVGWRRWAAIAVGAVGVLLVLKPGLDGFQPASMFAVVGVIGLAMRDLATRRLAAKIHSEQVTASAFLLIGVLGVAMMIVKGETPTMPLPHEALLICVTVAMGMAGYVAIVASTRTGDISAIAPFRYSRLVFGMFFGIVVFGERPDMLTYIGSSLIVSAGIYSLWRESRLKDSSTA